MCAGHCKLLETLAVSTYTCLLAIMPSDGRYGPCRFQPSHPAAPGNLCAPLQFFHLVPAQALRRAGAALPLASFEQLLCEVEGPPSAAADAGSQAQKRATLLRLPAVFTLAVVWESPQVCCCALLSRLPLLTPVWAHNGVKS